jgi:ribosomal protein S2
MEQPKTVKKQTYRSTTQHLTQNFFNIGKEKSLRNENNNDWIKTTPSHYDHIQHSFTALSIRKNLIISSKTISKGGRALIFHNYGKKITTKKIRRFFTNVWPNGLISNFKRIGRRFRALPNVVVVVVNEATKRFALETELLRTKINSFFVTSTNNSYAGLYTIFGNNDSPRSADFLNRLLIRSISVGFIRETSRVKIRRRRFPRLGSNQRPRT